MRRVSGTSVAKGALLLHPGADGLLAPADLERIRASVGERSGVLVYPTDTLYAVGCAALDVAALRRLRALKGREVSSALTLILGDDSQGRDLGVVESPAARALAAAFWPGPLTLALSLGRPLPRELVADERTVAVRVPANDVARQIARACGPLVATSANVRGEPPCANGRDAFTFWGDDLDPSRDFVIDAGTLQGPPSTIVDLSTTPRLARPGRIAWSEVEEVLRRAS